MLVWARTIETNCRDVFLASGTTAAFWSWRFQYIGFCSYVWGWKHVLNIQGVFYINRDGIFGITCQFSTFTYSETCYGYLKDLTKDKLIFNLVYFKKLLYGILNGQETLPCGLLISQRCQVKSHTQTIYIHFMTEKL